MTSRVEWNEDWLTPEALEAGLTRAAIVAQGQMRRNFGSEGGGVNQSKSKKKGRNVYYPSPPGAFPGVRTGFLRRAVQHWFPRGANGEKAPVVRVGVPSGLSNGGAEIADYAAALELSANPKMRRPWAMRSVEQVKAPMAKAFAQGVRRYLESRGSR